MRNLRFGIAALALLLGAVPVLAQSGSISGQVTRSDGTGLGGVAVTIESLSDVTITSKSGTYSFDAVPAGEYNISFTLGTNNARSEGVAVTAGGNTEVDQTVDWDVAFVETITVYSASRRTERLVEAPAAVSVVTEETITREASSGQLPRLLDSSPGAEPVQSGVYDYNFNARGFNSSLNRRILVLVDGRDPSSPFLGAQEWATLPFALEELESIELVRGPGSALYGADAFNGVINMVTKSPRDAQGGLFKLTGGDLDTVRGDLRFGGALGGSWYGRLSAGYLEGEDFTRSRIDRNGNGVADPGEVEYAGLGLEPVPLLGDGTNEISYGSVRLDKFFDNGPVLTLEGGFASADGPATVTGIGRVQVAEVDRPYARINLNSEHWNVYGYLNQRDAPVQRSLSSGSNLVLDTEKVQFEIQGNTLFADSKGVLIGGANYGEEDIDSANAAGIQTLMFQPVKEDFTGVFAQIEYNFSEKLKGVIAGRWDDSSLYESVFSPRAALVYAIDPNNSIRVNYGEAFQTPNYSEFFLRAAVAPPITAFAGLEGLCLLNGVSCGLDAIPTLALGNPNLGVEEVKAWEIGYSGIINGKAFLTIDYYNNEIENFITDLIPAVQPTLGRINPSFGAYQLPAGLDPVSSAIILGTLQGGLGPSFALLTNSPTDGSILLGAVSYTNFGQVENQGLEIGLNYYIDDQWQFDASYSWFDFEIKETVDGLLPNAPENKGSFGLTFNASNWNANVRYRWADGHPWSAGVFSGDIPSYDNLDLSATYALTDRIEIGLNVANVLDDEHFEIFGGDILERRALGHVAFRF
ncbi:MAG: TonB-dependent receptor [Acidobacteriota bacterium]